MKKSRCIAFAGVVFAASTLPATAWGAGSGPIEQGTFALSAEHLTGVFHDDTKVGNGTDSTTTVGFLGNGIFSSPYSLPRVGFDGFLIDGLSLGGSLVIYHYSPDQGSSTLVSIAPRVGYAYMFSDVVGIWPRGGFSYWNTSGSGNSSSHAFAFDVDVPFIFAPNKYFAITVGPLLDVSFAGKQTVTLGGVDQSTDLSILTFGLSAGLVLFF